MGKDEGVAKMNEKIQNTLAMVDGKRYNMDERTVAAICDILRKGDRVELIPVKDGVKVVRVRRDEVRDENHKT